MRYRWLARCLAWLGIAFDWTCGRFAITNNLMLLLFDRWIDREAKTEGKKTNQNNNNERLAKQANSIRSKWCLVNKNINYLIEKREENKNNKLN